MTQKNRINSMFQDKYRIKCINILFIARVERSSIQCFSWQRKKKKKTRKKTMPIGHNKDDDEKKRRILLS